MLAKTLAVLGLAATVGAMLTPAAFAQAMVTSTNTVNVPVVRNTVPGPTRYWTVPRTDILAPGTNLVSADLLLGGTAASPIANSAAPAVGFGLTANETSLSAQLGLAPNFEMDAGLGYISSTPWIGALNLGGKYGFMQEGSGGSIIGLAGWANLGLNSDANGVSNLSLQLGIPIQKTFLIGGAVPLAVTAMPDLNLAYLGANVPAGLASVNTSSLGLGLGADLGITDALHAIVDTNLGFPTAGLTTDSAFGVRYAFSQAFTGDLFVGYTALPATVVGPNSRTSLGIGGNWMF